MGTSLSLLLRLGVSLGVVLVLVKVVAGVLQRSGTGALGRRRGPAQVEVLLRQPIGRRAAIGVVRAGDRALVVGVTEHTITLLAEDTVEVLVPTIDGAPGTARQEGTGPLVSRPPWTNALDVLRDRTVRRR